MWWNNRIIKLRVLFVTNAKSLLSREILSISVKYASNNTIKIAKSPSIQLKRVVNQMTKTPQCLLEIKIVTTLSKITLTQSLLSSEVKKQAERTSTLLNKLKFWTLCLPNKWKPRLTTRSTFSWFWLQLISPLLRRVSKDTSIDILGLNRMKSSLNFLIFWKRKRVTHWSQMIARRLKSSRETINKSSLLWSTTWTSSSLNSTKHSKT